MKSNISTFLLATGLAVAGTLSGANIQSSLAATFTPLPGFTDANFNQLKNDGKFQEDWVAEGRIGGPTTFEQGIVNWTTNTTNNTPATAHFNWPNGTAVSFSVTYDTANNGTLTYQLDGLAPLVVTNITESVRVPEINHLFLRTRSNRSDTSVILQDLQIGGMSYAGNLTSSGAGDVDYLQISDLNVPFTLTGKAILSWEGNSPTQSNLAFQIKGGYNVPMGVPEPASVLGLLAVGGLGLATKRSKQS